MNYLRQIHKAVDYVEAHLDEDLSLERVSAIAGVSHWHFQRMFRALTHESLKGYIRSRRLSCARVRLLDSDQPILDIALRAGFRSQASFTRAFKQQHGVTPGACRAGGGGRVPLEKVALQAAYVRHLQDRVSLEPRIVDAPARILVGMPTRFESMEVERNRLGHLLQPLWDRFIPEMGRVAEVCGEVGYGVICTDDPRELEYVAAVEVRQRPATVPVGMVVVEIPACTWAVFSHRGLTAHLDHTVNYVYACWLLQSGRSHAYLPDLEIYDQRFEPGSERSIVDYAIPVR